MAKPKTFGDRLGEARRASGLSARALDGLAGLTLGHVSMIETGRKGNVETRTAVALAEVLGLSLDWLVCGRGRDPSAASIVLAVRRAERAA